MTAPEPAELLSTDHTAALVDFARTCKAAARAVSLYPGEHPAIRSALARVEEAARRMTAAGSTTLSVLPDSLTIDGRAPAKTDSTIAELAALLHDRLVGELRIERDADAADWRALLLLLSRTPEELLADGGIGRAWTATGQKHFSIREIDYAEVLREREGAAGVEWNRILEFCLEGRTDALDERTIDAFIEALSDPERVAELVDRVQAGAPGSADLAARVKALLNIVRQVVETLRARLKDPAPTFQALADTAGRMTPEMMLALISHVREAAEGGPPPVASEIVDRMTDPSVAAFVSRSVVAERGATERLALAFETLVPDEGQKQAVLELARANVAESPLGADAGFEDLWRNAADMLTSYSDKSFVSAEYGRELSGTRTRAIDVEALSDDPPERVQAWIASVEAREIRALDLALIRDLLRLESNLEDWQGVAAVAHVEIEHRASVGDFGPVLDLVEALANERGEHGRPELRDTADGVLTRLAGGPIVQHIVEHLRRADDGGVERLARVCHTLGAPVVGPLAIALAGEEHSRTIRRLRDLLLGFGAVGRESVEQLKHSANPAVRRTAIDLLRVFGGDEALPELASLLEDADPQVQRESIRAIVQIGTEQAYGVLEQALVRGSASSRTILQQLIGLRDERAIPLLCYVLRHTAPRGEVVATHVQIIDTLGSLPPRPESMQALREVLYAGTWWAPARTAALRTAAATALHRLGTPDALAMLREAASGGSRGVRKAVRPFASSPGEGF